MKDQLQGKDLVFEPLIDETQIAHRIAEIGEELNEQFQGKCPLVIGILNGAFVFMADLCRTFKFDCELSFTRLSSYKGTSSTGSVNTLISLKEPVKGRDIIIIEDIVDTGKTLHTFLQDLQQLEPASVSLVALLVKPKALKYPVPIDYTAFEISNKFVIGYGLDYDGLGRNIKSIYQLSQETAL